MGNNARIAALALLWAATGAITIMAEPAPVPEFQWGVKKAAVTAALGADRCTEFKPADKPKYRNKILSYIKAIDADLESKIVIVRTSSRPVIDYLFVGDKLYTIMENWGQVDPVTERKIRTRLDGTFGLPNLQKDTNLHIYSYQNDATKVLCYVTRLPDGASRCKVYYYTRRLFRMLITE